MICCVSMRTVFLLLIVSLAAIPTSVRAGCSALDADAPERQAYAFAHRRLAPLAQAGHADAQWELARQYWNGRGVAADPDKALRWTRAAAENGQAAAQDHLAYVLEVGLMFGTESSAAQAVEWYRRAAQQGFAWSQLRLGQLYREGNHVPKDLAQAQEWFDKARAVLRDGAATGDPESQFDLAEMYFYGQGVPVQMGLAVMLYRAAAGAGADYAQVRLAELHHAVYSATRVIGQAVPLGPLAEDYVEAYKWYALAARGGAPQHVLSCKWGAEQLTAEQLAEADLWLEAWRPSRTKIDVR
jgi:uncharacterized protein